VVLTNHASPTSLTTQEEEVTCKCDEDKTLNEPEERTSFNDTCVERAVCRERDGFDTKTVSIQNSRR